MQRLAHDKSISRHQLKHNCVLLVRKGAAECMCRDSWESSLYLEVCRQREPAVRMAGQYGYPDRASCDPVNAHDIARVRAAESVPPAVHPSSWTPQAQQAPSFISPSKLDAAMTQC